MILLEDLAALLGLILALFGVGLSLITGNQYWDVAGRGHPGVARIIHMKTLHPGPEELLVRMKVGVSSTATAADVAAGINAAGINAAEHAIREAEPTAQVIYVEPDIYVEGHVPDERPEPPEPAGH